jgi:hypothetical protein
MRISDLHKRIIAQPKPLLLDIFPNASVAYSLRKLRINYNGACIRVRRSSDNAEQDIGFVNNELDTVSLLSFVGYGNGFVRTWYNQSANIGFNLNQTNTGLQPQIINSGLLEVENGKNAIKFNGGQFLDGGNILSVGLSNNMATFAVARTLINSNSDIFFKGFSPTQQNNYSLTFTGGTTTSFVQNNANADVRASIGNIITSQQLYNTEFLRNISNRLLRNNNQVAIRTLNVGVIDNSSNNFIVGGLVTSNLSLVRGLNGNIQEIIIYHQPTTPLLSDVNTIINNYYNIY